MTAYARRRAPGRLPLIVVAAVLMSVSAGGAACARHVRPFMVLGHGLHRLGYGLGHGLRHLGQRMHHAGHHHHRR
ncbi:MAG: hypothetical protein JO127_11065 [Caulobacteraceae bacterium]|nr:hypothetical protein [Caulobacteraceae bacterium]